jgi:predicted RNase H-like HicB family nuclease
MATRTNKRTAKKPASERTLKKKKKPMKNSIYFAIFEPAIEGGYNVSFPDFPGCVTFGRTLKEAQAMGKEVLNLWVEELAAQRKRLQKPLSRRPVIEKIAVATPRG